MFSTTRRKPEINARNEQLESALYVAISEGYTEIIKQLIEFGAELKIKNISLRTPFHISCIRENITVIKILVESYDLDIVQSVLREKDSRGDSAMDIAFRN